MSRREHSAYDDDVFAWSQQQAAVLRDLARTRRDLPNELDLEHVAEEIEDLGIAQLRAVEKLLRRLLEHAIKLASSPSSDAAAAGWRQEVRTFQGDALTGYTAAMRPRIDLGRIWQLAVRNATVSLADHGKMPATLPAACPFELDELLTEQFDPDRIAASPLAAG
ncbi:MAG TPA: DUF29 domain-containing protein [Stellaceae bacterium]|jgi:hypothetical protein